MSGKDSWRNGAAGRMLEGTAATVVGGMIVWYVTSSMSPRALPSSSSPSTIRRLEESSIPSLETSVRRNDLMSAGPEVMVSSAPSVSGGLLLSSDSGPALVAGELGATALPDPGPVAPARPAMEPVASTTIDPLPRPAMTEPAVMPADVSRLPPPPTTEPVAALATPRRTSSPAVSTSTLLFYEDFSRYREGEATAWGQDTIVKLGLDGRKWIAARTEGTHTVGRGLPLPGTFSFECRYSAYMVEVTRGLLGWWKDPLSTRIAFLDDRGGKFVIEWLVACGTETMRINPLGPPPENTYYHTFKFSGTAAGEVRLSQPSGMMRILRNKKLVQVFINGQEAGAATIGSLGQLVGFEIDVVKTKNAAMSFTDFRIAR